MEQQGDVNGENSSVAEGAKPGIEWKSGWQLPEAEIIVCLLLPGQSTYFAQVQVEWP